MILFNIFSFLNKKENILSPEPLKTILFSYEMDFDICKRRILSFFFFIGCLRYRAKYIA